MEAKNINQLEKWLKKLERESWQLELLVSAFTIFLLIGAQEKYSAFLIDLVYSYSFSSGVLVLVYFFLVLIELAIGVLAVFLIVHLLLRGFWIGAIGLRSVQPTIAYEKLNYSPFFLKKLKKRIIGLDRMIVNLDEVCSVIFSLSFLIIFMLISFALFIVFAGLFSTSVSALSNWSGPVFGGIWIIIGVASALFIFVTGLMYLIDYFSLGFFKKQKWLSPFYYPIYRFYSFITLSIASRSIYYHLISKYSKSKIRMAYLIIAILMFSRWFIGFDQYQYFPEGNTPIVLTANYYDDDRLPSKYVERASIPSKYVQGDFLELFIRYNPEDNGLIKTNCPDFEPLKNNGINAKFRVISNGKNLFFQSENFEEEDKEQLLACVCATYQVTINDSVYSQQKFYFHEHTAKDQKGIIGMFDAAVFSPGENLIRINKRSINPTDSSTSLVSLATIPFWKSSK